MKVVVIGGTGLIGSRVVSKLGERGHDAVPASPDTGVDTITGAGLARALDGADAVVDVSNSPSLEGGAALEFFTTSTKNLLATEEAFGVRHHVALSIVGTDRLLAGGYFRAKLAQEDLIRDAGIPYTIVRATQFFEFLGRITDAATEDGTVRLQPIYIQPLAADDVAKAVGRAAVGMPVNGVIEVAGPQRYRLDQLVRQALGKRGDPREVLTDVTAPYFGVSAMDEGALLPSEDANLGETRLEEWVLSNAPRPEVVVAA